MVMTEDSNWTKQKFAVEIFSWVLWQERSVTHSTRCINLCYVASFFIFNVAVACGKSVYSLFCWKASCYTIIFRGSTNRC